MYTHIKRDHPGRGEEEQTSRLRLCKSMHAQTYIHTQVCCLYECPHPEAILIPRTRRVQGTQNIVSSEIVCNRQKEKSPIP